MVGLGRAFGHGVRFLSRQIKEGPAPGGEKTPMLAIELGGLQSVFDMSTSKNSEWVRRGVRGLSTR
jgi:hypothetical protein